MTTNSDFYLKAETKFRELVNRVLDKHLTENERKVALYSLIALLYMFDRKYFEMVNLELINEIEWEDES